MTQKKVPNCESGTFFVTANQFQQLNNILRDRHLEDIIPPKNALMIYYT